jgi:serine/threonine-protein kinase RsbW
MEIEVHRQHGVNIFKAKGEMDLYNSADFRTMFNELFQQGHLDYIFDLSELTYIDSTGVGTIISTFTTVRKQRGQLYITGVHGVVKRVIEFTKLNGFLPIVDELNEALEKLGVAGVDGHVAGSSSGPAAAASITVADSPGGIRQNDAHPLFEKKGMYHKEFNLDLKKVRYLSQLVVQNAPAEIREINLLEQQVSEIIKNAVRHGNRNNPNKKVKIWFAFERSFAHLIVEDEGEGFREIERWNEFYMKKQMAFASQDFDEMMKYISYRTVDSTEEDGGNALCAAVEFWNVGVVFNSKGNAVAVKRAYY